MKSKKIIKDKKNFEIFIIVTEVKEKFNDPFDLPELKLYHLRK